MRSGWVSQLDSQQDLLGRNLHVAGELGVGGTMSRDSSARIIEDENALSGLMV